MTLGEGEAVVAATLWGLGLAVLVGWELATRRRDAAWTAFQLCLYGSATAVGWLFAGRAGGFGCLIGACLVVMLWLAPRRSRILADRDGRALPVLARVVRFPERGRV